MDLSAFVIGAIAGLVSGFFLGIWFIMARIRRRFEGIQGLQQTIEDYWKGTQVVDEAKENDAVEGERKL